MGSVQLVESLFRYGGHNLDDLVRYGADSVEFRQGDVFVQLDRADPVDTVLCFGFLYHTIEHMALLRKIARLRPSDVIIETGISRLPGYIVEVQLEGTEHESRGTVGELGTPDEIVIGRPTRGAFELMLRACGFSRSCYYDWRHAGIERWDDLEAYIGKRISLRASV